MLEENNKNNNGESKIRKVLFNEITFFIAVCSVVIGVALFITKPDDQMRQDIALIQKDIQIINSNHLATAQKGIDELKGENKILRNRCEEMDKKLIKIMVKLGIDD